MDFVAVEADDRGRGNEATGDVGSVACGGFGPDDVLLPPEFGSRKKTILAGLRLHGLAWADTASSEPGGIDNLDPVDIIFIQPTFACPTTNAHCSNPRFYPHQNIII